MKQGLRLFWLCTLFTCAALFAQESLWRDQNPYVAPAREGEIVAIEVNESFNIVSDGQWKSAQQFEMKLVPDTKNIPFLTTSQQNKSRSKSSSSNNKTRDSYRFHLTGILGARQADGNYPITAQKTLNVDGKPVNVRMTGIIDARRIKQGTIESRFIGNLALTIHSEPPFPKDEKLNLKPPAGTDPNSKPTMTEFSDQLRKELLIEHMKQILGGLNQ
ncbi:MAG: flagellar basal body L-ring protein FlgH [Leptospiraceae bacterium]|nr:flagellar basal body L-ring protein FlgH [Leptospiraceae bacterium]